MEVRLGPAGTGGNSLLGLDKVKILGLNACEIEFTYGVKMSNRLAKQVGEKACSLGIELSVHAPYYINLNSSEKKKLEASKKRILQSCERGHFLHAKNIVFHPGFYGKKTKEETFELVKKTILDIQEEIKKNSWDVSLAPETTGKKNVFGDLDEILRLVRETKCSFCIDFAHLKARNNGVIDYNEIFLKLKEFKHIQAHFSGINYTNAGEQSHRITNESEIKELAKAILKHKINITIINESPDPLGDSVKTKRVFEELGYKFKS